MSQNQNLISVCFSVGFSVGFFSIELGACLFCFFAESIQEGLSKKFLMHIHPKKLWFGTGLFIRSGENFCWIEIQRNS